jgi:single-stranded DNA-binding protein
VSNYIETAFFATVGRDAEFKTSKAGKPYLRFSVRDGEGDAAQWISIMYFGADAAETAPKMQKGVHVYVEGSLRLDQWEQQDGTKRAGLSVMSFHCRVAAIGRNKPKRERTDKVATAARDDFHNDAIGF